MDPNLFRFLHVFVAILLIGSTFYVVANPKKHTKKKMMMVTGILSLLVFIFGFGLLHVIFKKEWTSQLMEVWFVVKSLSWLVISAASGLAYRKSKSVVLSLTILATGAALYMAFVGSPV